MADLAAAFVRASAAVQLSIDGASWLSGVRTNLDTNPSREATSGTTEVARNYAWDPRATAGFVSGTNRIAWVQSWFGSGSGAGTATSVTGATDGPVLSDGTTKIPTYLRKTWSASPTGNSSTGFDHTPKCDVNVGTTGDGLVVTPGQVWTITSWVRQSAVRVTNWFIRVYWRDSSFTYLSNSIGSYFSAPAGQWTRISATFTVPANAVRMSIRTDATGDTSLWQPTDTLDGTGLLVDLAPVVRDYWDGIYSPDSDLTAAWTGTANASTPILTGPAVVTIAGALSPGRKFASTQWAAAGARSLRIVPYATDNSRDTYASPGGDTGGMRLGMVAGHTYTAIGTIRLTAAQTGSLHDRARTLTAWWKTASGYTAVNLQTAPNAAGVYDLRGTFTIPADATEAFIRLYNGAAIGGGDVWWDKGALIEGVYTGPWWDGSNPPASIPGAVVAWSGTVDGSTSTLTVPDVTTVTASRSVPGGTAELVRGVISKPVVGGYLVATDHEMPLNTLVSYTVAGYSAGGVLVSSATAVVDTTCPDVGVWVKAPGRPDLTVLCIPADLGEIGTATVGGVYQVIGGGSVAVSQFGGIAPTTAQLVLRTDAGQHTRRLRALLDVARVVLLQPVGLDDLDAGWYFASQANRSNPGKFNAFTFRYTTLNLTAVRPPAGQQGGAVWTYASVKGAYATYAAVKAAKASYFALTQGA